MIIAAWRGFEIDSSEGYYIFDKEMEHLDDGWSFLTRLLSSPLVWRTVRFSLQPRRGRPGAVDRVLAEWRKAGRIRAEHRDEFSGPVDLISGADFLDLFQQVRGDLEAAAVYFAVTPPRLLDGPSRNKLKQWFFRQFTEEKTARARWADYLRLGEEDIGLTGCTEWTESWTDAEGLEATFEIGLEKPFEYKVFVPAVDPTMIVYLLRQIADRLCFIYEGDHGITIDRAPDLLSLDRLVSEDDLDG